MRAVSGDPIPITVLASEASRQRGQLKKLTRPALALEAARRRALETLMRLQSKGSTPTEIPLPHGIAPGDLALI